MKKLIKNKYSKYELEILNHIEKKKPKSVLNVAKEAAKYTKAFQENATKRKAISLRILESDLTKIKAKAIIEGIPYQSLIGSVIHKYVSGNLIARA